MFEGRKGVGAGLSPEEGGGEPDSWARSTWYSGSDVASIPTSSNIIEAMPATELNEIEYN
jgi:hypothetical protein